MLPVPYYHVVFTLPDYHIIFTLPAPKAEIAFQNKRAVYAILFRAAAEAMRDIAAEPANLNFSNSTDFGLKSAAVGDRF